MHFFFTVNLIIYLRSWFVYLHACINKKFDISIWKSNYWRRRSGSTHSIHSLGNHLDFFFDNMTFHNYIWSHDTICTYSFIICELNSLNYNQQSIKMDEITNLKRIIKYINKRTKAER